MVLFSHKLWSRQVRVVANQARCFACGTCLKSDVRVRFAPSPTGMLHLGGLRTALYNYLFAKSKGGKFILRIEDTDQTRFVPGAFEKLTEALAWVGIIPDEGPEQGGDCGPYLQSQRLQLYQEKIKILLENNTAYHCFCTPRRLALLRKEAARRGEIPKYDNRCRHLTQSEVTENLQQGLPSVVRFKLTPSDDSWHDLLHGPIKQNVAEIEGDPILMKSDSYPTYHLANIIDDHYMNITHVLRGEEWSASTMKHHLLYKAFGWKPPSFAHLPLILNQDGTKLSKRQNDIHVKTLQDNGYYPESVLNLITLSGGGFERQTPGMTLPQLVNAFSFEKLNTNSTRLEMSRIEECNQLHLRRKLAGPERAAVVDQVYTMAVEYMKKRLDKERNVEDILKKEFIEKILAWSKERIHKIDDLFVQADYLFLWGHPASLDLDALKLTDLHMENILQSTAEILNVIDTASFHQKEIVKALKTFAKSEKIKFPEYMRVLRLCISGLKEGPGVGEMMEVLGKEVTVERLQYSIHLHVLSEHS